MHASYPLACYFDKYKCRLLRYEVTNWPAVSLSDTACGSDQRNRQTYWSSMVVCHGMGWWVLPKLGARMCIFSCSGVLMVLDLMVVCFILWAESPASSRVPLVRGLWFPAVLSVPWEQDVVVPELLHGLLQSPQVHCLQREWAPALQELCRLKRGISTCSNAFYGTAPVCNMIFFLINPFIQNSQ